jgi:uncharacterized damage-inducible protein DinB
MNPQTTHLSQQLAASYDGEPWHGSSLQTILAGVTTDIAFVKPAPLPYSIANLVAHITQWRIFVAEKLKDNAAFAIELNSPEDWPEQAPGAEAWSELLAKLAHSQADLLAQLAIFPDSRLTDQVPGKRYSYLGIIEGLINHDVYHAGQIALLKKLLA